MRQGLVSQRELDGAERTYRTRGAALNTARSAHEMRLFQLERARYPRDLEIVAELLSADAVTVEAGQRVIIEGWGGQNPLEGRVRLVEPFGFTRCPRSDRRAE
jgi:hypothetical protein